MMTTFTYRRHTHTPFHYKLFVFLKSLAPIYDQFEKYVQGVDG